MIFLFYFIEASEELEELWKDFNENGVDVGPYEEDEESPSMNKVRRKSKTCISDQVSLFFFYKFIKIICDIACPTKGHSLFFLQE